MASSPWAAIPIAPGDTTLRQRAGTNSFHYCSPIPQRLSGFTGAPKVKLGRRLHQIRSDGIRTVALFGAAYTAEVVYAVIKEVPLEVVAVVDSDPKKQGKPFGDLIIQPPDVLKKIKVDAVVITSFGKQEEIHDFIRRFVDKKIKVVKLSNL